MSTENTRWGWKLPMNLQLFAEGAGDGDGGESGSGGEDSGSSGETTYSQSEVIALIQSETDKRVTAALNKQKKEYEKKLKVSGMGEQERKLQEAQDRNAELEEMLAEANQYRARNEMMRELSKRSLPAEFADLIAVDEDENARSEKLGALEKAFNTAVEERVKSRLAGKAPPKGDKKTTAMTVDEIMSIRDPIKRQQAIQEHMELFE